MRYILDKFSDKPEGSIAKFKAANIEDAHHLLNRTILPHNREQLAKETGLSQQDIVLWSGMADLVRVKGIGAEHAEQLVRYGGISCVQDLIQKITRYDPLLASEELSGWEAFKEWIANLRRQIKKESTYLETNLRNQTIRVAEREDVMQEAAKLSQFIKDRMGSDGGRTISAHKLAEAVEEALEVNSRLVLRMPDDGSDFLRKYLQGTKKEGRVLWKMMGVMFGILFLSMLFLLSWLIYLFNKESASMINNVNLMTQFDLKIGKTISYSLMIEILIILGLLLLGFIIFIVLSRLVYFLKKRFTIWLFSSIADREFYLKATDRPEKKEFQAGWLTIGILIIGTIPIFLSLLNTNIKPPLNNLSKIALPASLFGFLMGVVLCLPRMLFFLLQFRINWDRDRNAFIRYLVDNLVGLLSTTILLVVFLGLLVPALLHTEMFYEQKIAVPALKANITSICESEVPRLIANGLVNIPTGKTTNWVINFFIMLENNKVPSVSSYFINPYNNIVNWMINTIGIWMIIGASTLVFFYLIWQ